MNKAIVIGAAVLLALVIAVGVFFWYTMMKGSYKPGMVRAGENLRAPLTPPKQSGDAHFWNVEEDIQVYHFSEGKGRNVLVVHGGPGHPVTEPWPGLTRLADDYTFNYYDQRGCGRSTRPIDKFTSSNYYENAKQLDQTLGIGAQLADIERIRQILGEEKLIVVGHSFGAFLASLYAAEFPERVESLVLVAPAYMLVMPHPQEEGNLFEAIKQRLPEDVRESYTAFIEDEYLNFKNLFSKSEADLVALNERFGEYYEMVYDGEEEVPMAEGGEPGGWMVWGMYMSMGTRHDYRPALEDVTAPVLVLHGADDLQPESASRMYADAFPNSTFHIVKDTIHMPFYEQPEAFAEIVEAFLSE